MTGGNRDDGGAVVVGMNESERLQATVDDGLIEAIDSLLAELLGAGVYPDNRVASCNKARHRASGHGDPVLAAMRERARAAEHRVAGLCAANADCYRYIAELRGRLGITDENITASAVALERQALRIVERERDEARAEITRLRANMEAREMAADEAVAAERERADAAERERDEYERACQAKHVCHPTWVTKWNDLEAEIARLRSRVQVTAEDVERVLGSGARSMAFAWARRRGGFADRLYDGSAEDIAAYANSGTRRPKCGLDILDEMAAMPAEGEGE